MFWMKWGIAQCGLSVILGAFGAHALEEHLSARYLDVFETAVRYQFFHGLALMLVGFLMAEHGYKLKKPALGFAFGSLIFCGSLYALVLTGIKKLGMITPIGGSIWILSWATLFFKVDKK